MSLAKQLQAEVEKINEIERSWLRLQFACEPVLLLNENPIGTEFNDRLPVAWVVR